MSIFRFFEGATEKAILDGLKRIVPDLSFEDDEVTGRETSKSGKDQINRKMADVLGPRLGQSPVRCLVFRDLDTHVDETVPRIVQGVANALRGEAEKREVVFPSVDFLPHPGYPHVYTLALAKPDLRLALHIAAYRWRAEFIKATIDDYVLALALEPTTAGALIAKKGWRTTAGDVLRKVTEEMPGLLSKNGIPLQEAKVYVRLYAAVIQEHTSPPVFATRTLAHATETDLRQVFAPLLAAIEFVRS